MQEYEQWRTSRGSQQDRSHVPPALWACHHTQSPAARPRYKPYSQTTMHFVSLCTRGLSYALLGGGGGGRERDVGKSYRPSKGGGGRGQNEFILSRPPPYPYEYLTLPTQLHSCSETHEHKTHNIQYKLQNSYRIQKLVCIKLPMYLFFYVPRHINNRYVNSFVN